MAGPEAPQRYRRIQALAAARLAQQVLQVWRELMNPSKVDASWSAVRAALTPLVRQAREQSAALAGTAYMDARHDAGVDGDDFTVEGPLPLLAKRLESALDVTGPVEFKKAIAAGKTPQQAMDAAAVRLVGSTQYLALEGGRQVMQRSIEVDEQATGWARVTDADPCAWCAMLASRGPVYKSAKTAGDPRKGGNRYHDHCGCQAWPAFTNDEPFIGVAEQLYDDWLRETRGRGGKHAVNAFRRWWESEGRASYTAPDRP
ncbi:VG15 protein [Streptomyces hirsutus]|uniref:VG15 protein n=1 Tax=Streptomyces hirsutus TaxID=35620 RepID=UPI0036A135F7